MEAYPHLSVDAEDLIEALDSRMDEGCWLLDRETGEIRLVLHGELIGEPDQDEDETEDWEESDRFGPIRAIEAHEAFTFMEDFVEDLPNSEGARSLARALGHAKPFRSFKDTLCDFPELRERWFKYQHGRMLAYAEEWLTEHYPGAQLLLS